MFSTIDPHWFSISLLAKKNMLFFGVGMVAENIRSNPDWRMWTTVIGMIVAVVIPLFTLLFMMQGNIEKEVSKQLKPFDIQIENIQKVHDGIDAQMDLKLSPIFVELKHIEDFHDKGTRFSFEMWERGKENILAVIGECKADNRSIHADILDRVRYLEQKGAK